MSQVMNDNHGNEQHNEPSDRAAYEKPAILYREPLEAVAAVCQPGPPPAGPSKTDVLSCPEGPISS